MQLGSVLEGFAEKPIPALHAERFSAGLAPAQWVIRQRGLRRSHLLVIEARRGAVALRGTHVAFEAPALLWLPADLEGDLQVEAGAQGYLIAISEDFLTKTVAGSAEALHLRRTIDRLVLLKAGQVGEAFNAVIHGCDTLVRELHSPGRGTATMTSSHVLLLCLHLWRSVISGEAPDEAAHGVTAPGWSEIFSRWSNCIIGMAGRSRVMRPRWALPRTSFTPTANARKASALAPSCICRLIEEACTRLQQLDLPVEQIGYGLGFRDPGYFSRFFRKHQGVSPGVYRRRSRLEQMRRGASYAAWP